MGAKTIMIQGTGSGVGKSVMVAALCRILKQDGFEVAPFKSQNMALNSYVTKDGGEMGRAQVVQAQASSVEPTVDMNPILLKPMADCMAQVIIQGKPYENMSVKDYQQFKERALKAAKVSLERLMASYDFVVIEGAGSPAEINLQEGDIVNMKISELADAPVLLVGDIDRGGIFASFVGTLELLPNSDRKRIAGFIINKFRGDVDLLAPGLKFLEDRTNLPVLGLIPYFHNIWIEEEDSLPLRKDRVNQQSNSANRQTNISVIYFPHISNFTDFDILERDMNVNLSYVRNPKDLNSCDLIIIPGSKSTIDDLAYLKRNGLAQGILKAVEKKIPIIGICGGFQMLGKNIVDPGFESKTRKAQGIGILDIDTHFQKEKVITRVQAKATGAQYFFGNSENHRISGYEIHMGESKPGKDAEPAFKIIARNGRRVGINDGAISKNRLILGTYIHGLFDSPHYRRGLINFLHTRKNKYSCQASQGSLARLSADQIRQKEFDKLADLVRNHLDMKKFYAVLKRS